MSTADTDETAEAKEYQPSVVFVDADHFEPGVSIDTRAALTLVDRRDGIVIWHDALRYDVQTALPRIARTSNLPVHLIAGTNLAVLCFLNDEAVDPGTWKRVHER